MKAAQINSYGDPRVIAINEVDKPAPKENQVLVEVKAASLNPFDTTVRSGMVKAMMPPLPATLGGDIAGDIVEVGSEVTNFKIGDKVYGQANVVGGNSGAFAELAATAATQVGIMPGNLDYEAAAAISLVGVSALQALTEHIKLQSDQKLFINGGAGGIGSIAIQLAKHLGAYVATTASNAGTDFVESLGADEVIDYKAVDFTEKLNDYDAVFDTVGGPDFVKAYSILKAGGIAVSMAAPADEGKASQLGITAITQATKVNTERLDKLSELIEQNVIKPQIAKVYPLEEVVEAFQAREAGGVRGKIVLKVN